MVSAWGFIGRHLLAHPSIQGFRVEIILADDGRAYKLAPFVIFDAYDAAIVDSGVGTEDFFDFQSRNFIAS